MARLRILLCLYIGFVLSLAYTLVFGAMGIRQYTALERKARELEANLASLASINRELSEELASLSSDPETIALLARDLGYYRPGDRRMTIQGLQPRAEGRTVGHVILRPSNIPEREGTVRLVLLVAPLALLAVSGLAARLMCHDRPSRRS